MMSFEDKINGIIGKKYDAIHFHCYDLVMFLVPMAPTINGDNKNLTCTVKQFKEEIPNYNLEEIQERDFKDKDIILLGGNNIYHHVGVYFDGGVVHNSNDGVVYQPLFMIKKLYNSIQGVRV